MRMCLSVFKLASSCLTKQLRWKIRFGDEFGIQDNRRHGMTLRAGLIGQWKPAATSKGKPPERLFFTLPFFQHLESHRRIYHATIGRESEWTVELHMQRMLRELVREDLCRHHTGQASAAALDLAIRYVVGALWAIVIWWMESKKPLPPEQINQIFQRLVFTGLDATIGAEL